jgi:hypothetical protein
VAESTTSDPPHGAITDNKDESSHSVDKPRHIDPWYHEPETDESLAGVEKEALSEDHRLLALQYLILVNEGELDSLLSSMLRFSKSYTCAYHSNDLAKYGKPFRG